VGALSGKILHGEVTAVPTVADTTSGGNAGMFKVVVSISDAKGLTPGLSCAVEIVTETINDAIFLPISAVFREGDSYFVYPARGGGKTQVDVKVGKSSDEFVEILSGAEAGMKVLLSPPEKTEDK
jgi:HlyD family secretion protein